MERFNQTDPDWKIKLDIAKSVAGQNQPSLMKFYQAYGEEFGTRPPEKLIDYFKSLLKQAEPVDRSEVKDLKKTFIEDAINQSFSVLKFRQAYLDKFNEVPSAESVELFIKGLGRRDTSQKIGPVNPALVLINQLSKNKSMTILEFRQLYKQRLGKLPTAEHLQLFLDRLSKEPSPAISPQPSTAESAVPQRQASEKKEAVTPLGGVSATVYDGIINSAILTTDGNGTITLCNKAAETLFTFSRAEVINRKNILSLLDPKDLEVYYSQLSLEVTQLSDGFEAFIGKVNGAAPLTKEWRFISEKGRKFVAELTMSRLPREAKSQGSYLFEIFDLTEQQDTRRKMHEMLEEKEAQSIERENLLMAISRKVLDPVTSIKGFSELLNEEVDPKLRRYLDIISGNADTITRILTDYVVLHTIREGDFELETAPFNPMTLMDEAIRYNTCWLGSKNVEFVSLEYDQALPLFLGDRAAIQHILTATVGHAVDLPGVKKIEVSVRHKDREDGRSELCFDLGTEGGSISSEELEAVFSSSENLLAGNNINPSIPVLSLAVCKQLARMMRGNLEIRIVSEKQVFYRVTAVVGVEEKHGAQDAGIMRILVAENDPAIYHLLNEILTEQGHQVTWARSGQQVIDYYLHSPGDFDLILMDVGMPEKGGVVATKEIRSSGHTAVPIVALTACNSPGDSERFYSAGMSGYIEKPFTKEILVNSLVKWRPSGIKT